MRCAIYTRKSGDEAADVQYSSLEAQRELCEKYIASQIGEGWTAIPDHYDDGGYSGGNLNRPALKTLVADIERDKVDIVVVYKIDRLSRSLRDFLNLVGLFEQHAVTFVAITQSFNTTTSMGRLTLNVLLSFAQFERELTGERLRDWFAGARRRGLWMHGKPPLGYRVMPDKKLDIIPNEADLVRRIYAYYPRVGSVRALAQQLTAEGYLNNRGRPLLDGVVKYALHNRVYLGEMPHAGEYVPGDHEPIITEQEWQTAQRTMTSIAAGRRIRRRTPVDCLLKGLIFGPEGWAMTHYFAYGKNGQIYRYYLCRPQRKTGETCPIGRLRAAEVDAAVTKSLCDLTGQTPTDPAAVSGVVRRLVERIDVSTDALKITLLTGGVIITDLVGRMSPTSRQTKVQDLWRQFRRNCE